MTLRVLVTRPQAGAGRTVARLSASGFEAIALPLTQTKALPPPLTLPSKGGSNVSESPFPSSGAAVAVTSANGVRHAPPQLMASLAHLPCYAVGGRTAEAARAAGFSTVLEGPGDATGLAAAIAEHLARGPVVYLCGKVRFPAFEQKLAAAGIDVVPLETYDTVPLAYDSEEVVSLLGGRPVDRVLLYSVSAAQALAELAARPALAQLVGNATLMCLSERVAAVFRSRGRERTHVSPEPNEDALFRLLQA